MPARIEIGRKGFRGCKRVGPSTNGALCVDCTRIKDPFHKKGSFTVPEVAAKLEQLHGQRFLDLVDMVVEGVLADRVVYVFCMMGKNRSQAVAWRAREKLRQEHPAIVFEGPVCLPGIERRILD
jgi:hypothetical protein